MQCLKLSQKSCRSSCLESQIINIRLRKNEKKFPVLLQSYRPRPGGPVGISIFQHCMYASVSCDGLTHWGRVMHVFVNKLTIIGSDNGLSPDRCQGIIWTNAGILLTWTLGTNFTEMLSKIQTFSFKKMHLINMIMLIMLLMGLMRKQKVMFHRQKNPPQFDKEHLTKFLLSLTVRMISLSCIWTSAWLKLYGRGAKKTKMI